MPLSLREVFFRRVTVDLRGQEWLSENAEVVLDAVVDAIVTIDSHGKILSHNQATERLFGYTSAELDGQPLNILMPEPYKSQHQHFVDHYCATGEAKIIGVGRELAAVKRNGTVFPVYLAISEFKTADERYFVGIIRDLTEQKNASNALLEQKDRAAQMGRLTTMGEMTASIAHEINQPLTAISMYAQACIRLLKRDDVSVNKLLEALEKLNTQSIRAGEVIERIQRFVQNVGGQRSFADINALLRDISHLAAGDARLHGIQLVYDLDTSLPEVFCDPVQIQQVVLNLVRNAIDAMHEIDCANGNEIKVISVNRSGSVMVRIEDQGPGISRASREKLFSPFYSTKSEGMGMGLAICKTIIEDHDGYMGVETSSSATPGAAFYFELPTLSDQDNE